MLVLDFASYNYCYNVLHYLQEPFDQMVNGNNGNGKKGNGKKGNGKNGNGKNGNRKNGQRKIGQRENEKVGKKGNMMLVSESRETRNWLRKQYSATENGQRQIRTSDNCTVFG